MSKIEMLLAHARTMCMMYEASKDARYLERAKKDLAAVKTLKVGFFRPLGALEKEAA